jgi:hypothetical protein
MDMDTDTKSLKISAKRRKRGLYIAFFVSLCFSLCFFWLMSHLFTDILHALGDNDVTFHEIFGSLIAMEFVPFYFVYRYYYSEDSKLETDRLREAAKKVHNA